MSTSQKKFLSTIHHKLGQALLPQAAPEHPGSFQGYSFQAEAPVDALIADFTRELEALAGQVHLVQDVEEVAQKVLDILGSHQAKRIITWDDDDLGVSGLKDSLSQAGIAIEESSLAYNNQGRKANLAHIDQVRVGLTGAQGGLADTGAIALVSGAGRGRLASLLPPVHIALLSKRNLYPALPAFLADQSETITQNSNLVFIAGPSRTGDIELTLSMGVHGPGEVHVIIIP